MKLNIRRYIKKNNLEYITDTYDFKGTLNYANNVFPIKLKLTTSKDVLEIVQKPWILKLINCLPILNTETFAPFKVYLNGVLCGKSKNILFKPIFLFYINDDLYEIRQHNNNYISLMHNNVQLALYKKDDVTISETNNYSIKCVNNDEMIQWIILFCLFIDRVFYPNNSSLNYWKYEKNYVINDEYSERLSWEPA